VPDGKFAVCANPGSLVATLSPIARTSSPNLIIRPIAYMFIEVSV
jgi:hypothetical protein